MNVRCFKICLFFIFISFEFYGQKSWTLDDCVSYALTNNLMLKDLNYMADSRNESYKQSYRELLPTIGGNASYNTLYGRSINPDTNSILRSSFYSNNYSIGAEIDIFNGFKKMNTIIASRYLHEAAKEDISQEKYLLAFRVMMAFYDVKFNEEQLKIAQEQLEISTANVNLVKKQIEVGIKAGSDLYESQSVLETDKLVVVKSVNNIEAAKLVLLQEMNLNNSDSFEINSLDNDLVLEDGISNELDSDSIYNKALGFIPAIKAQEFKVEAAEKDISIARGNLYPSLKFSYGYATGFFETTVDANKRTIPFSNQIKDNASQFVAFSLIVPISDRWSKRSWIKQQKITLLKQNNSLDLKKQELNKIIQKLVQDYKATLAEYSQTKQNVASLTLAFTITQKKYANGLISVLEMNQTKTRLAWGQNENLQVMSKMKVLKKTINFYMGLPIFNILNSN
ncbi:TolC family protein [Flavobacterium sp. WG21]|uniref:TolC family protein n=1 Tax=Flavobacterium sp. WG21 TaxID=1229487 RepID=UPI000348A23A|nr:TolC family protein [Flavobacterium sp. WG21]